MARNVSPAEVLSGLTIAQLTHPGCPVIFGGAPAAFHMLLMTSPMTSVESLQVSSYGEIPEHTTNYTMKPRGAAARPDAARLGVRWGEKAQSWAEAVSMLYEEAHQRQWSSAQDIPWTELPELGWKEDPKREFFLLHYLRMWKGPRSTDEHVENLYAGRVIR